MPHFSHAFSHCLLYQNVGDGVNAKPNKYFGGTEGYLHENNILFCFYTAERIGL